MIEDKRLIPKARDKISFIYIEKARIEQDNFAIQLVYENGTKSTVPTANINTLFLGPGTTITQQAIKNLCECGCLIVWSGEEIWRVYGYADNFSNSSKNLLWQCRLHEDNNLHMKVVRKMYQLRYPNEHIKSASLEKLRGLEGDKVHHLYQVLSQTYNVEWNGRQYNHQDFNSQSDINKAITYANQILYGTIAGIIHVLGFSTALGFIHTGNMNSFVFDIADLYKETISIPIAFQCCKNNGLFVKAQIIIALKNKFSEINFTSRVVKDIYNVLSIEDNNLVESDGYLWDPKGFVDSGKNYSNNA